MSPAACDITEPVARTIPNPQHAKPLMPLAAMAHQGIPVPGISDFDSKAAILVSHGLLTVGETVDEAAYLYTLLEKSCRIPLMVEAAGLPKVLVGDEEAAEIFQMASQPETLFVEFQPSYKLEEYLNPDFKD